MKKCPYCAEEIQDEAVVCRYCGRDLPSNKQELSSQHETSKAKTRRMSYLLYAFFGFVAIFLIATFLILLGVKTAKPSVNIYQAVGILFFSLVLLAVAAKVGLRKFEFAALISTLMGCWFIIANVWYGITLLANLPLIQNQTPPTAYSIRTPHPPTLTPRSWWAATATKTYTSSYLPAEPECYLWSEITLQMNGDIVCVMGLIHSINRRNNSWTRYEFSDKPNTFFTYSKYYEYYDHTGKTITEGMCILVEGPVQVVQKAPYIDMDKANEEGNLKFSSNPAYCR